MFDFIGQLVSPVVSKLANLIPDPNARAKAIEDFNRELLQIISNSDQMQNEINKIEASNSNIFVSGWRPFIGWVCGFGILWAFLLQPILVWLLALFGNPNQSMPLINSDGLFQLVIAMLGMGGIRTFEKIKGVASK